ncbi:Fe-Mn family superoxide dismutase [Stenotrophomonas sp. MMGLT7]|uniref:superoxide dismutase n=1 Tax=Stenotrophomonas sp. MMGLT7 TaxID=2901227 RepID=UPI001E5E3C5F|nr:Fe-Mn family superoxide dismutase [Stenotrophomonas sp. MMGLT7]MCD7098880.1 superoxide dismutase [Stenotrophomonas sp. MMGLT7]
MPIELPDLPYSRTALEPAISGQTVDLHHGVHQRAYVDALNNRVQGTELAELPLEEIVRKAQGTLFELAALAWNHDFYWRSMRSRGGGEPGGALGEAIARGFGDFAHFKDEFTRAALGLFGPGWIWLVQRPGGALAVVATRGATTPLTGGDTPLLVCDVWEHAYYLDHQDDRGQYLQGFWKQVNWDFATSNLRD